MGFAGRSGVSGSVKSEMGSARKVAARSASTYGSESSGKDRDCIKHLDRRRHTLAPRGEIKIYVPL